MAFGSLCARLKLFSSDVSMVNSENASSFNIFDTDMSRNLVGFVVKNLSLIVRLNCHFVYSVLKHDEQQK